MSLSIRIHRLCFFIFLLFVVYYRVFLRSHNSGKNYSIIGIAKVPLVCKSFLKEASFLDKLAGIHDLPLSLLPLDTDLLSVEDPSSFAVNSCLILSLSSSLGFQFA